MNEVVKTFELSPRARATVAQWILLYTLLLSVLGVCGWLRAGVKGFVVATIAVMVCAASIAAGRLVGRIVSGPGEAHYQMLFGMLPRIGIPVAFCLIVYSSGRDQILDAGLFFYLLSAYVVSLGFDTWQTVRQARVEGGTVPRI